MKGGRRFDRRGGGSIKQGGAGQRGVGGSNFLRVRKPKILQRDRSDGRERNASVYHVHPVGRTTAVEKEEFRKGGGGVGGGFQQLYVVPMYTRYTLGACYTRGARRWCGSLGRMGHLGARGERGYEMELWKKCKKCNDVISTICSCILLLFQILILGRVVGDIETRRGGGGSNPIRLYECIPGKDRIVTFEAVSAFLLLTVGCHLETFSDYK